MKNHRTIFTVTLGTLLILTGSVVGQEWSIKADYSESCCCAMACPCIFGSAPTHDYCDYNGLIEIKEGHFGDVSLDGISVVETSRMGEWLKYTVSKHASDEQVKAAKNLVAAVRGTSSDVKVLAVERASISVERTNSRIRFSTPSSKVEIEMVTGYQGKPTKILNLRKVHHQDVTQYKTILNKHKDGKRSFEFSGTTGLTSKIDAHGKL